jgi:DNA-binding transcriptional MerR regulator
MSGARAIALPDDDGDEDGARGRSKKAPNAFRTISEVADELHIPQHVLRFWETKFPLVKPLKRGGGRRYYRPDDINLLRRISDLLYIQGYTIKGVQRLLRESGGRLGDNIPPPSPEEAESEPPTRGAMPVDIEPQLPMPGLAPAPAAPRPVRAAPTRPQPPSAEAEVERLRSLLAITLKELEALRAMLP